MKTLSALTIIISLITYSNAWAGKGAVGAAETNMMQNVASQGATAAYTSKNSGKCGSNNYGACVRAALGAAQLVQLLMQFGQAKDTRDDFALDEFTGFDPNDMGYCLDPAACEQDELDQAITDTPLGPALQSGDSEALEKAMSDLDKQNQQVIADLEKKGFSVDPATGTVTDPNGNKHDLNSSPMNLSQGMKDALKSKFAAIDESVGNSGQSSDRGLASQKSGSGSSGGGSGLKIKEEYVDEDSFSPFSKNSKRKKKIKDEILSAMADKNTAGVVGMAGDNIFQMIQRRYEKKKKSKEFIFGR